MGGKRLPTGAQSGSAAHPPRAPLLANQPTCWHPPHRSCVLGDHSGTRPPGRTEFRRQRWEEGNPPRPSPESPVAPQPHPSLPPRSLLGAAWRLAAQSLRSWRAGRSSVTRKPSTRSLWEPGTRRAGALTFLLGEGVRSTSMDSTLLQTVKHGHGPGYDQVTKTHEAPRAALPPAAAEHQGSPVIDPSGKKRRIAQIHVPAITVNPIINPFA